MLHKCIKPSCGNSYEDSDTEAYYCPSCLSQKKAIAQEIDKKFANRETKPIETELQKYDRVTNGKGFMHVKYL